MKNFSAEVVVLAASAESLKKMKKTLDLAKEVWYSIFTSKGVYFFVPFFRWREIP